MNEDNIPVIIGSAQWIDREADLEHHLEPLARLTETSLAAADDAGISASQLATVDTIAQVDVVGWYPDNGPDLLARHLKANPAHHFVTAAGGQAGVALLNTIATRIVSGESQLALIAGCNHLKVLTQAMARGKQLRWTQGGNGKPTLVGGQDDGNNPLEADYGLDQPITIYPLFENALRAKLGLSLEQHRQYMGELFTRFTAIAAANPYAWFPVQRSAEELTTVTPDNRMIAFPYPKYLNAVLNTEQAASLLVCSAAKARSLGIPAERWIYWRGGADSRERAWWVSERPRFDTCPSMQDTHISALHNAGLTIRDVGHFDLYSCFPAAVEMACEMLDLAIDDPRGFTVTGGLPYAGGPASSYTLHSLAQMTNRLRQCPGDSGLVTGNGWYLSKHSAAVLSTVPGSGPPPVSGLVKPLRSRALPTEPLPVDNTACGTAHIETYTVVYNREGDPAKGIVLGKTATGRRFIANTPEDRQVLEAFVAQEQVGNTGTLINKDRRLLFIP